ncbi:coiled-coil domain-containing protein 57 isoform 3-T3 [Chlamydotis macqueenii]
MEKELNYLLQWKEKEGKDLHACQFQCQKKMLQDVKKQLQDMHEKFNKLKEDFVYNLRILEERDKELEHYDVTVTHLKTSENAEQAEMSHLRVQLGKAEQMLFKERRKRHKLHYHYRQHIKEHKLELERFCSSRNSHLDHQHEEYVNLKHHMERKIQELEEELACENQIFQYSDKYSLSKDIPTLEIKKLQEQNANLHAAIAQMRKEMESLDEHMVSSLPRMENRQLAEQDSLCTNKILTGTTKVGSATLDCIVNPDAEEKGPKPKVLEEKMVDLGQQLSAMGPGVDLRCGVRCTLQGMQNKLEEAARKISILSQEKQQLIEMGNRLRAELRMALKEGLRHPVSSKHCTVCIASGSLFPRELVKRTQCQLSALKHLQHRLTIQVQLDFSIENHGPEHTSSKIIERQSPSQAQQVRLSSSRVHNFCQGICQSLEMESSPSVLSSQRNANQAVEFEVIRSAEQSEESQQNIKARVKLELPAADLTVRGTRLEVQQKFKSGNLACVHPIKQKVFSNMAKIRNYNIKD